jgi:hypothetical protein
MRKYLYILLISFLVNSSLFANENKVDCLILEDENSIICKYIQTRVSYEKQVTFEWIEPNGKITRVKELNIPAGHGSVYDYRYIKGRALGLWTFKVTDDTKEYTTTFTIE